MPGQANLPGQATGAVPEKAAAGLSAGAASPRNREALSLAAIAAADKGVELDREGLEDYASAIDPDRRGAEGRNSGNGSGDMGGRDNGGKNADSRRSDRRSAETETAIAGDPLWLKEKITEAGEQNPLLKLLNRLPGKNGQRWIVLPFSFTEQGKEYRVSLRILLNADQTAGRLVLEIDRSGEQGWLFNMDKTKGNNPRLEVLLRPPRRKGALDSLGRELAVCMELPPECVSVQNCMGFFPFVENRQNDVLRSINEEV